MPSNRSAAASGASGPRVLVLGRPGSGKGTQCRRLARYLGVPHISTGDLFRATVATGTPLAQTVKGYMEVGELVPDDLVVDVVDDCLGADGAVRGFVLDGFPRTVPQAEQLADLLLPHTLDLAIDLVVSPEIARARLLQRLVCDDCGRTAGTLDDVASTRCAECGGAFGVRRDDDASTISRRLALHDAETGPLVGWLAAGGVLVRVDGHGTPAQVEARVDAACERLVYSDLAG
jgi:adenylate kinase